MLSAVGEVINETDKWLCKVDNLTLYCTNSFMNAMLANGVCATKVSQSFMICGESRESSWVQSSFQKAGFWYMQT